MTVEFRLLGDVEARVDGRRLEIGHALQRCVLVVLLVDVNHPIPVEQLVERVWSSRPPASARRSLTSYVSRLRNLLADVPGVTIARKPGGYVLTADALSVDLHRFRLLASQARATADPDEATALFDRALGMWDGEPFGSLDTTWVNDLRLMLLAERFLVELDRNDVALRAGRHGELLPELIATQAARPLDERLAGQLMLAQYRSGRQREAVETYRAMRQRLVDELGVEPGPLLRETHQRILSGETDEPPAATAGTVEFQLLGDVAALVDGRQLDIGHSRQRCVLAALLVDVNRPIALEQLIQRVWSDRRPRAARISLASYVSRLRTLLADAPGVRISRGPGGYVFSADPTSVDLHRFRDLVSQARATADPSEATVLFDRALDAFGGDPFGSLDTGWINEVRGGLVGERLSVALDRNDVALRAGQHAELLLELTEMQAARPLDERLAGQLMLAQYHSGRQADALNTYREIRRRLVDELGLDPGPALREVHRQILRGETETSEISQTSERVAGVGAGRPDGSESSRVSRPLVSARHDSSDQLRRVTTFFGRAPELADVADALHHGPLVTLTGSVASARRDWLLRWRAAGRRRTATT